MPTLYPCVITITQEGEPLAGAMVRLFPQGFSLDWTVSGMTDDTGTAIIHTDGFFRGVPAGEYKVTVEKSETVEPPMPDVLPTNEIELQRLFNRLEEERRSYRLVDPGYGSVDSTPLSITVGTRRTEASFDVGQKHRSLE